MSQLARTFVSVAISLALIVLVQWSHGWRALLQPWLSLSYSMIATALVFVFASYALRAMRLWDYFRNVMRGHFGLSFKLMLQHNLLNNLLPMRTGEISFPILMSRYFQIPMTQSVPALLWFRLLDLHVLVLLAWIGIARQWLGMPALLFIALLWLAIPAALVLAARAWQRRLYGQAERHWRRRLQQLLASLPQDHSASLRSWLWTALNWMVKLSVFAWVMLQFAPMSFYVATLGAMGGDITSVLPVHGLAGAGTYEAGVVAALLPLGVSPSQSLVAAVNLHLFMLGAALLGGALSLVLPTLHTQEKICARQIDSSHTEAGA